MELSLGAGWTREAAPSPARPGFEVPRFGYAGGGLPASVTGDETGGFEHNAWRPIWRDAPDGDRRYRKGELLLATEEDFGPATEACANRGQFTIASLEGSYDGEAWRSTPANPFRLQTVGTWNPAGKEGSRPVGGPYHPLANFCSAHYFDVDGNTVTYAWYGEARASSTSRIRSTRRSSRTGDPTTASSGPPTCTTATSLPDRSSLATTSA